MKKKILLILIMVIPIVFGSFMAPAQSSKCDQKNLERRFRELNAIPDYVSTDSSKKYSVVPINADKKIYLTYKGDSIPSLNFEPVGETKKYFTSGICLEIILLSTNTNRSFLFVKGREIRSIIPGLPKLYFRTKIDHESGRLLFEFYEKDGTSMYAEFNAESGLFCPEELLELPTPKKTVL